MKFIYILALFVAIASADKWAVLFSGSTGYSNYRHQSDVYHMYHVLLDHDFDASHIITIAVDDLANNSRNPFPGKVFNHPGNNQRDVYEGVVIDYKKEVSAEIYYDILLGNEDEVKNLTGKADVKVLKTTEEDDIFLYYIDHGGTGLVAVPDGTYMLATDLIRTFKKMYEQKLYHRIVYYLEACESGSMWLDLPTDINMYALSSTLPDESSWGTYCPGEEEGLNDVVDGKEVGSCLGEVWSCFWLEQDDTADLTTLTLQQQFEDARNFTTTSTSLQYGDLSWSDVTLSEFITGNKASKKCMKEQPAHKAERQWNSRDNDLKYYEYSMTHGHPEDEKLYVAENLARKQADQYFYNLVGKANSNSDLLLNAPIKSINWDCYRTVLDKYQSTYKFNDYSLKYAHTLAALCNQSNDKGEYLVSLM